MTRLGAVLLTLCLSLPLWAQDDVRPQARPIVEEVSAAIAPAEDAQTDAALPEEDILITVQTPGDDTIRPLVRGSTQAVLAGTVIRPQLRPFERPDLAYGAQTRPLFRAEQNLFAFSPNAIAFSPFPILRPAAIEAAAEERRVARLRGQVCGDPQIQGTALGTVNGPGPAQSTVACGSGLSPV